MQSKTSAIVLHLTKYTDSASILHLYTKEFGRSNYIVNGIYGKKSNCKAALFEPLSILDVEVVHLPNKSIQRIQEIQLTFTPQQIPFHAIKRSIALFLSEMLYRTLRHPLADESLFEFLQDSIKELDSTNNPANFHLVFLMHLSQYLGFYPNLEGDGMLFDLESSERCSIRPLHPHFLSMEQTAQFTAIAQANYDTMNRISLNRTARKMLLEHILSYYQIHLPDFQEPHSLDVLTALFD